MTAIATATVAIDAFVAAANAFAVTLAASGQNGLTSDSALLMLNDLPGVCATTISLIRVASTAPEIGGLVTECEVLLHLCEQLGDFWFSNQMPLRNWTAPADMPLITIAQSLYGVDAMNHLDELLSNNPSLLGMVLIPAGTMLNVSTLGEMTT